MPGQTDSPTLRATLIDTALAMITEAGPQALSLRELADRCETSTHSIYTLFGGKHLLLEAAYQQGIERLEAQTPSSRKDTPPRKQFMATAAAWHDFATDSPSLYGFLFHLSPNDQSWRDASAERTSSAWKHLAQLIEAATDSTLDPDELERRTHTLWAAIHGTITLDVAGYHDTREQADEHLRFATSAIWSQVTSPKDTDAPDTWLTAAIQAHGAP